MTDKVKVPPMPKDGLYMVRIRQTDFSAHFPPTIYGITEAVRQWAPVYQMNSNGHKEFEIFYDAQVEDNPEHHTVYVTALISPAMARHLEACKINWDVTTIKAHLLTYLDLYRPVCVKLEVRVLVMNPNQEGPYR